MQSLTLGIRKHLVRPKRRLKFNAQQGTGLVELMISLAIGMVVITGALTLTSATLGANASQIKMSRLNNEVRMAMTSITRDMRRAGYHHWAADPETTGDYTRSPQPAPTFITTAGQETVTVSYDEDANGSYGMTETFGFRFHKNTIQTSTRAKGNWSSIIDSSVIKIATFSITNLSQLIPMSVTGGHADITLPVYRISITAYLVRDPSVKRTIQETVTLRNVIVS
ncbi:MAG: type II secretory pathway component PulJ [Rhodoferax sp.]|jgi:type II secretory pathway component PulJ